MIKYPVYKPFLSGNEKKYVNDCLDSSWISSKGKYIDLFENSFKDFLNLNHATSVSNGTVALHLALLALNIKEGDEVIVSTLTYIASVNAIKYVNATPIFVDCNSMNWNIDADKIVQKISSKTKAIMAVHLYGASCEMDKLLSICKKHNLLLIEDVAEGFGTKFKDKYAGSFGDVSTFSFFGNKTITTGEGGMVVTKEKELIQKVAYLKSQAVSESREYWHNHIGYNFRMTNICAAIGHAQIENASEILNKKEQIALFYKKELENIDVEFQVEQKETNHSYWMVSILFENEYKKQIIRNRLSKSGIETRPVFFPIHTMPMYYSKEKFKISDNVSKRGINLPSYPELTQLDIKYICDQIKK
jgi:perosamine synthetase|tara:strand:- start:8745 stop:9824 length:1080 start_codon:yes stop_codon:yes gene_type:complete